MFHWGVIALLVKSLVRIAAKRGIILVARVLIVAIEKEIKRKIENGEARDRMEALRGTFEEWKRWFNERPGQGLATE